MCGVEQSLRYAQGNSNESKTQKAVCQLIKKFCQQNFEIYFFLNIFLLDCDNKAILRTMLLLKLNVVEVGIKKTHWIEVARTKH